MIMIIIIVIDWKKNNGNKVQVCNKVIVNKNSSYCLLLLERVKQKETKDTNPTNRKLCLWR